LIAEIEAFHCLLGSELGVLRNGVRILLQSLMLAILSHLVATDTFLPYPNPMARCLISSYRLGSLRLLYQLPPPNPRPQGPVGHCPRPRLSVLLYQLIGYTPKKSFLLTMLNNCFQFLANILSLFLVTTVDRRLLTVWGQFVCGAALFFFGGTSLPGTYSGYLTTVCVMLVWGFVYQLTLGTVAWTLVAELASYRLRARTQGSLMRRSASSSGPRALSSRTWSIRIRGTCRGRWALCLGRRRLLGLRDVLFPAGDEESDGAGVGRAF
jgi:hypothetical protein